MWPAAPDPAEELAAAAAVRAGAGAGAVRVAVRDVVRAVLAVPASALHTRSTPERASPLLLSGDNNSEYLLESGRDEDNRRESNPFLEQLAATAAGAATQTVIFTMFNAVDFVNFWFCKWAFNMELWSTVALTFTGVVGSCVGAFCL